MRQFEIAIILAGGDTETVKAALWQIFQQEGDRFQILVCGNSGRIDPQQVMELVWSSRSAAVREVRVLLTERNWDNVRHFRMAAQAVSAPVCCLLAPEEAPVFPAANALRTALAQGSDTVELLNQGSAPLCLAEQIPAVMAPLGPEKRICPEPSGKLSRSALLRFLALCKKALAAFRREEPARQEFLRVETFGLSPQNRRLRYEYQLTWDDTGRVETYHGWSAPDCEALYLTLVEELDSAVHRWSRFAAARKVARLEAVARALAEERIKIVFLAEEYAVWPSLKSVYDACRADARYEAQLVWVPFRSGDKQQADERKPYLDAGYPVLSWEEYDLSREQPDIAVYVKPYDMLPELFCVEQVNAAVPHLVYIPYGIETNAFDTPLFHFGLPLHELAWLRLSYAEFFTEQAKKFCKRKDANIVTTAFPRLDIDWEKVRSQPEALDYLRQANGRKTVFGTPTSPLKKTVAGAASSSGSLKFLKNLRRWKRSCLLSGGPTPISFLTWNGSGARNNMTLFLPPSLMLGPTWFWTGPVPTCPPSRWPTP